MFKKLLTTVACFIGFLVIGFILICVVTFIKDNKVKENYVPRTTTIYEQKFEVEEGKDDFVGGDSTPININLSSQGLEAFEEFLSNVNVDYQFSDSYNIDKALQLQKELTKPAPKQHKYDVRVNGRVDAKVLYDLVLKNNKEFLETSKSAWCYEEYSSEKLTEYCQKTADMLNKIHESYPEMDFDTVCCYINDLKILNKTGALDFAAVEITVKVLHICEDKIDMWNGIRETTNLEQVLYHEMMHLFQVDCVCSASEGNLRVGINCEFDELEINPLAWYWLCEASAEIRACEVLNIDYTTYQNKIGYLETLNYIMNLSGNNEVVDVQDLNYYRDVNAIYDLFDVTSPEDKLEFIKMMYNIEILQQRPQGFTDWYKTSIGIDDSTLPDQERTKLSLTVKEDALLSATRLFYRNLARIVNSGDATLQDVYYLTRIYECDFQNHLSNNIVGYLVFFKDLYPEYLNIQEEFFRLVAENNQMDVADVAAGFQEYSINIKDGDKSISPNCTLNCVSAAQKADILKYEDIVYKKGYKSVKEVNEECREWLVKAPYEDIYFVE